jgi:predicted phage tail protein
MMRTIHLHGALGKQWGKTHQFDVDTAGEALRALHHSYKGFILSLRDGHYKVVRGRRHGGMELELGYINDFRLGAADLHIIPVAVGSKTAGQSGTIKAIAGVALIGAAIFFSGGTLAAPLAGMGTSIIGGFTYGNAALIGLGLVLAGASQIIAKPEKTPDDDKKQKFTFSGPVNVNEQGTSVPVIYGQVICGSQPVSSELDIEDRTKYDKFPI